MKLLLAALPVGLLATALVGCNKNAGDVSTQVADLSETYRLTQASGRGLEEQHRVYSAEQNVGGVTIPADLSTEATRQDELNALAAEIRSAHSAQGASPSQKAVLARMLAEIVLSDAQYLALRARDSYTHARSRATDLQPYADQINEIQGLITILKGDRELIINTLQTGETGGAIEVEGIDELNERADAIQGQLDKAREEFERYQARAQELSDQVIAYEREELELKTRARSEEGHARYDTLNEAVIALYNARVAEIESEYNSLLARVESENADLNAADLVQVQGVIGELEEAIAEVRQDITALRGKVQNAEGEARSATDALTDAFQDVNDRMEVLVFDRLQRASVAAEEGVALYGGITTTGQARAAMQQEQLNAMLTQLLIYQQYALALSSYKSAVDTLLANGREVLGPALAGELSNRSDELGSKIDEIKQAADPIQTEALTLSGSMVQAAGGTLVNVTGSQDPDPSNQLDAMLVELADIINEAGEGTSHTARILSAQHANLQAIQKVMGSLPYETQTQTQ